MEVHPFLTQNTFNDWHKKQEIHVMQFSPLGNQNSFYRDIYWSNGLANRGRLIDEPLLAELGKEYGKDPVQIALAWGVNRGRTVIPKSTIQWQIEQNLESEFVMEKGDLQRVDGLNLNLRFNMPNEAYRWPLYKGLDGA
jgi:diketogulonate reductase-like aldo/keto reductase